MLRKVLIAKIHRATVTQVAPDYVGSLTIDADLMDAAGILPNECVLVADIANGTRHWTYAIAGERGSGTMCVNGAAAHLVNVGDLIIVMCFGYVGAGEAPPPGPKVVLVDDKNRLQRYL